MNNSNAVEINEKLKTIASKSTVFYRYKVTNPHKEYEIDAFRNFYETEFDETPKKKLSDDEIRDILLYMYKHPATSSTLLQIFPSSAKGVAKLGVAIFALVLIFVVILVLV